MSGIDPVDERDQALFDPRRDEWGRHFRVEAATGALVGLTPVGPATISRLQLNSPIRMESRRLWSKLGLVEMA